MTRHYFFTSVTRCSDLWTVPFETRLLEKSAWATGDFVVGRVVAKIDDMARDLIRFSGFEPEVDIKIEYIGLRPGEKLFEELIIEGEDVVPTSHEKIMVLKGMDCNLQILNGNIHNLIQIASEQKIEKIKVKLQEMVPEYRPV